MLSEKKFIVTIGNHGTLIAMYQGNNVKHKLLVEDLNEETQAKLKEIFYKNKSVDIEILLDTTEQSYKRKSYPAVKQGDLKQIIKRDSAFNGDKDSIKNYTILNNKKFHKQDKRWECLFIAASNTENLSKWLSFLLDMPNRTSGIYMLPIESFTLFKNLKNVTTLKAKIGNKRNDIYCLITETKVGGLRQTVFSEEGIIFTRTLSYSLSEEDAMEKYEHDIYSAFEYLKRIFPDLRIAEFDVVNILSLDYISRIEKINNVELNITNLTPAKAALELGYNNLLPKDSGYCDILISKIFASSKKRILKFSTAKLLFFERFFLILKSSYYFNLSLLAALCAMILFNIFSYNKNYELTEVAEVARLSAMQNLNRIRKSSLEGAQNIEGEESTSIERVIDIGKNDELFGGIEQNFDRLLKDLEFLKDFGVVLNRVSYTIPNINNNSLTNNNGFEIRFGGKIINKSGDIEDLFQEFDSLVAETKKNMPDKQVKYSELPRNIDFNKKYYDLSIDFTITKAK
jgi:hypothetical protein